MHGKTCVMGSNLLALNRARNACTQMLTRTVLESTLKTGEAFGPAEVCLSMENSNCSYDSGIRYNNNTPDSHRGETLFY